MNPTDDNKNYKWGIFYNNPNDLRILVPKRIRMNGYMNTSNFAKPKSLFLLILIAFIVGLIAFVLTKTI